MDKQKSEVYKEAAEEIRMQQAMFREAGNEVLATLLEFSAREHEYAQVVEEGKEYREGRK